MLMRVPRRLEPLTPATARPLEPFGGSSRIFDRKISLVHFRLLCYSVSTYMYIYLHNSCMRACATVQHLLCHGSYCNFILSLARTSCRPSFPPALLPLRRAGRPPAGQLPDLFAEEIRPNPRQLMTQSPLWCCTSIIRSSALVRASSSLSMVHTRAWPRTSPSTKIYFHFCILI